MGSVEWGEWRSGDSHLSLKWFSQRIFIMASIPDKSAGVMVGFTLAWYAVRHAVIESGSA